MPPLANGPLFYVMGPSGAGKDSVLARARQLLAPDTSVIFAHRYITRPAEASGENHVALSDLEFAMRRTHGLFAFHWQAHGNHYGIGREIHAWRKAGSRRSAWARMSAAGRARKRMVGRRSARRAGSA